MTYISVREVTPIAGKSSEVKSRVQRGASIMSKHGSRAWATQVMVGDGAGDFHVYGAYDNLKNASKSFQEFSADPEMVALMQEGQTDPAGVMRGPWVGRLMYGSPASSPMPVSVHRDYHLPRSGYPAVMALASKLEGIMKPMGVEIAIGAPLISHDHEMIRAIYRFSSLDHWGEAVDQMAENDEFAKLINDAGEVGTLKKSRLMMNL